MDRRKALATAGAITGTVMAATLAAAANFGLLGLGEHGGSEVGKLRATRIAEVVDGGQGATTTTVAPEVEIRYEDVAVAAGASGDAHGDDDQTARGDDGSSTTVTAAAPGTLSGDATVTSVDDHAGDDSHDSIEEHHDDDHRSAEHEGAEDDD